MSATVNSRMIRRGVQTFIGRDKDGAPRKINPKNTPSRTPGRVARRAGKKVTRRPQPSALAGVDDHEQLNPAMKRNPDPSRDPLDDLLSSHPVVPSADFTDKMFARLAAERDAASPALDAMLAAHPV